MRNFIPHFKWIKTGDQLKHHKAQTVPVYTKPVGVLHNHFRSQILGGANKTLSHPTIFFAQSLFAQTKICESNVALAVNQDVLWLDISIHNTLVMEVFKRKEGFRYVKFSPIFREFMRALEMIQHFSTIDKFHN